MRSIFTLVFKRSRRDEEVLYIYTLLYTHENWPVGRSDSRFSFREDWWRICAKIIFEGRFVRSEMDVVWHFWNCIFFFFDGKRRRLNILYVCLLVEIQLQEEIVSVMSKFRFAADAFFVTTNTTNGFLFPLSPGELCIRLRCWERKWEPRRSGAEEKNIFHLLGKINKWCHIEVEKGGNLISR